MSAGHAGVDLYWLPLGAGGQSVRLNGRIFEAVAARLGAGALRPLPLGARGARAGGAVRDRAGADPRRDGAERGVVAEGAVGTRWAGRLRLFRYEVRLLARRRDPRRRRGGREPAPLSDDPDCARRLLELVPQVPDAGVGP